MAEWTINAEFTGKAPLGVGSGYPPRGLYEAITTESVYKASENDPSWMGIYCTHKVTRAFVLNEETKAFEEDAKLIGTEIFGQVFVKGCYKPNWTAEMKAQMDERNERKLSALIVSHANGITAELIVSKQGVIPLTNALFDNLACFVLYDPPPAGSGPKVFAEVRHMDAEDFQARLLGTKKISWPQDGKTARGNAQQAMGAAGGPQGQSTAGSFLPVGAVAGGAAGVPQPVMGAAVTPPPPIVRVTQPTGFGPAPTVAPVVPDNGAPAAAGLTPVQAAVTPPGAQAWGAPQ